MSKMFSINFSLLSVSGNRVYIPFGLRDQIRGDSRETG